MQGSGWGALSWEPLGSASSSSRSTTTRATSARAAPPLLVLDMWEHAYYLQYKNVKADWVDAFWNIVNWPDVAGRFERVKSTQARSDRRHPARPRSNRHRPAPFG